MPGGGRSHVGASHKLFLDLCSVSRPRRSLLLLTEIFEVGWLPSARGGQGMHLGLRHGGDRLKVGAPSCSFIKKHLLGNCRENDP